jgi:D-aspartate ligase
MQFKTHDFRPVILGGDITAYSLVRTFHEAYGLQPLVVNMTKSGPIALSRLVEHRYVENLEQEQVLLDTLVSIGREYEGSGVKLLVLGCGDWYVRILIENKDLLAPYFLIPYIDEDLLNRIVLKDQFYGVLSELGIAHPATFVYDVPADTPLDFDFTYPIVAKPANSALYHYAQFPGKKKVFILDTRAELDEVLRNLRTSAYDGKFLIQEFIPGADTGMRVLTCYSDVNGVVRFASVGHTLLEEHVPSAIGNPCAIISEPNEQIVADATRFLEHIGYTGFSNFDVKFDPRDGTYKFFEINVRLGRSNFYNTAAGYNVAEWMVRDLVHGEPMQGVEVATNEHLFTFVPKFVISRYVADDAMRDRALRLFREGRWSDPQSYPPDLTLKRRLYNFAYHVNQARKFHTYLGRQR